MNSAKILIVEDDFDMSNVLRMLFEQQGYDTSVAGSGKVALEMCRQQLPHIVILDIMMPEVDGYEVCQRLRKRAIFTVRLPIRQEGSGGTRTV